MMLKIEVTHFWLVLTMALICSCSRVTGEKPRPPILVPLVQSWPTNVLAAAGAIKISKENSARYFAGEIMDSFFTEHRLYPAKSGETALQTISRDAIIELLGPPDDDTSPWMTYYLGHYSGTSPLILFEIRNNVVVLTSTGHGDGPACTVHDHTKDFDFLKKKTAEPALYGTAPKVADPGR